MPDTLVDFLTRWLGLVVEAAPFLLLGTLASGLIDVFLSRDELQRWAPRRPLVAALLGSVLGVLLPVGEVGVVPVARRLIRKGLPLPLAVAFLLAGPIVNPVAVAATYAAFHERAAAMVGLRVLVALGVAIGLGVLFAAPTPRRRLLRAALLETPQAEISTDGAPLGALREAGEEFVRLSGYLVLGALLAAALWTAASQHPPDEVAPRSVQTVLAVQGLGWVQAVTGPRDAFVARDLADSYPLGALLGFLTLGAMLDVKSVVLLFSVLRMRALAALLALACLATTLAALWVMFNVRL